MTKPKKTDPIPGAYQKIKMRGYTSYVSSRSGRYRVYPDGRIFIEDTEPLKILNDRRQAARELFNLARLHVQEVEEQIEKSRRKWWENREIDFQSPMDDWQLDIKSGELTKVEAESDEQEDETHGT